jgi:hypothetical protein
MYNLSMSIPFLLDATSRGRAGVAIEVVGKYIGRMLVMVSSYVCIVA